MKLDEIRMKHFTEKNGKTRFRKLFRHMKLLLRYTDEHHVLIDEYDKRAKALDCTVEEVKFPPGAWAELEFKW